MERSSKSISNTCLFVLHTEIRINYYVRLVALVSQLETILITMLHDVTNVIYQSVGLCELKN